MMTDRELLELAAKAVGFGGPEGGRFCWTESQYPFRSNKKGALWNYIGHMDTAELWNPLTDDGDALRLAVKLGISLRFLEHDVFIGGEWQRYDGDPNAATRRAIVIAAANIGEAK